MRGDAMISFYMSEQHHFSPLFSEHHREDRQAPHPIIKARMTNVFVTERITVGSASFLHPLLREMIE